MPSDSPNGGLVISTPSSCSMETVSFGSSDRRADFGSISTVTLTGPRSIVVEAIVSEATFVAGGEVVELQPAIASSMRRTDARIILRGLLMTEISVLGFIDEEMLGTWLVDIPAFPGE